MSGPKVVALEPKPIVLSNEDFLRAVFGKEWSRAHVCGFRQDPGTLDAEGLRHLWAGGPAKTGLEHFTDDVNAFFVISLFHPDPSDGKQRRRKANFDKAYCVVIDDVDLRGMGANTSAKVPAEKVKLDPSWALETSPGNFQLGYILKNGDPRGGKVSALLDALVASGLCPDGSDPGMKGVTRYVRLPVGTNTKAKYGETGWSHVLGSWHPNRTYTLEEIADAYGVWTEVDKAEDDLLGGTRGNFTPGDDVIWNAILNSGTAQSEDLPAGKLHVTCPFVEEHTGRADSGCTYLGDGRWSCFHGHCEDRAFDEFTKKFRADFPEAWKEAVRESFADATVGDEGVAPSVWAAQEEEEKRAIFGDEYVEEEKEDEKRKANPFFGGGTRRWSGLVSSPPVPPEYVVPGYVPRGLVTSLYGVDGIGKNMLMQRACMTGVTQGEFLGQPVGSGFKAAFFGVEDTDGAILDRGWRIGQDLGLGARDWKELDARFAMPELIDVDAKLVSWDREGKPMYGSFVRYLAGFVAAWKPDLVVLDPISDLFEDEESNRQKVVGFMRVLIRFARKKNLGLVLLGHPARSEGSEYSGSGAWSSKARSRMFMEYDEDDAGLIWLRHRKGSYGPLLGDRECRFNGAGVLVDRAVQGGAGVAGQGRGVQLSELGDALRDLAQMGEITSAQAKARNNFAKMVKAHGLIPGASARTLNTAVVEAIRDGFLIGNYPFDGTAGTPDIRYSNRTVKKGLWFKP